MKQRRIRLATDSLMWLYNIVMLSAFFSLSELVRTMNELIFDMNVEVCEYNAYMNTIIFLGGSHASNNCVIVKTMSNNQF